MSRKKSFSKKLRDNLVVGLLALTPLFLTLWILASISGQLDALFYSLVPPAAALKDRLGIHIPGIGFVFALLLLSVAGAVARTFLGKIVGNLLEQLLNRVPVVRNIYTMVKQMARVFFSQDAKTAFQKVVIVPYPSKSSRALAFLSGRYTAKESVVFVPTAPNPTSGYVLIFKDEDIDESELTVEEAFKIVLSCGAVGLPQLAKKS